MGLSGGTGEEQGMRNVILYIAMSLDGYLADANGGVAWLDGDGSDSLHPGSYEAFSETVDTVLMGYRTYRQIVTELSPETWPYCGKTTYVWTHRELPAAEGIVFTSQSPAELIAALKTQPGQDIWVCGGANVVQQLLALDLLDRLFVTVIPTLLGDGIRLFSQQERELPLKLIAVERYNGMAELRYQRRKPLEAGVGD